ncbi:hypothetical protein OVN20_06640 [Microcella daejeonensis]|uniref:hypothetical protein n=1 Tax=Microcella daejeonensis TaxID=2994971 RepID=UPI002270EB13|nr:hypothetical protein [Microcella daejeonensis]WAB85217.1 hypothetical protein OVN20_06640 [Microcella daejeonensis]
MISYRSHNSRPSSSRLNGPPHRTIRSLAVTGSVLILMLAGGCAAEGELAIEPSTQSPRPSPTSTPTPAPTPEPEPEVIVSLDGITL